MNSLTLRFGKSQDITGGDYYRVYRFPFTLVDTELIDSPEEMRSMSNHRVVVKITSTRRAAWEVSDSGLRKVLFEIGRRHVQEKVSRNELSSEEEITANDPAVPFDPSRIDEPDGAVVTVERKSRRIGF